MAKTNSAADDQKYIPCNTDDPDYFGAKSVIDAELRYIQARRGTSERPSNLAGLALSGGGIRSASFALGIMQALANKGWLEKIDYLSTVSGGGYLGSSLTWVLKSDPRFGVDRDNFPFATSPMSGQAPTELDRQPLANRLTTTSGQFRGRLLRFLRQNAKYLTPGDGINLFSIAAVALRNSIFGFLVYEGMLTIILFAALQGGLFGCVPDISLVPDAFERNWFIFASFGGIAVLGGFMIFHALGTYGLGLWWRGVAYPIRRFHERLAGYSLPLILGLLFLGLVPYAHDALVSQGSKPVMQTQRFDIKGQRSSDGTFSFTGEIKTPAAADRRAEAARDASLSGPCERPETQPPSLFMTEMGSLKAGVLAVLVSFLSALGAFIKTSKLKAGRLPLGLFVTVGVIGLLCGMVIFSYSCARLMSHVPEYLLPGAVVLVLMILANVNHLSFHRYYRDRLMETFLPNVPEVLEGNYERSQRKSEASTAKLHGMCLRTVPDQNAKPGPYHIINTNVVLVSSANAKYRVRGGDNFILSPACCGSNATGWRGTDDFLNGSMTLASAMAISGAAVNPSAGCGGEGITRSPFLSILMGILNLRLGYWVPNPRKPGWLSKGLSPNFLLPGLCEVAYRKGLNENAAFLQLSDGGHFENLGLYELIRRKLPLIIVCDGSADPKFTFGDLANAIEKVRADFGALIMINGEALDKLIPRGTAGANEASAVRCADQAHLLATIKYADNSEGRLIYLTTTFFRGLSADLYGYKKEHSAFPDEPTSDQFFDERQFEAYRELGFQAAWNMMQDEHVTNDDHVVKIIGG